MKIIDSVFSRLYNYIQLDYYDKSIGLEILESIVMDKKKATSYSEFDQINIVSKIKYNNVHDKRKEYIRLFEYLKKLDNKHLDIKAIKFYNNYAFNIYSKFIKNNLIEIEPIYEDCIIFYADSLSHINQYTLKLDKLTNYNLNIKSISDYLTNNTLHGRKYKAIKNIHLIVNKFNNSPDKWLPYQRMNNIVSNINNIEKNLIKYIPAYNTDNDYIFIERIIEQVSKVNIYFKNNKNNLNANILVDNYNNKAPEFIKHIANTEPVDLEFVDPYIYDNFYNDVLDKYVVKVKSDNMEEYRYYIDSILGNKTSLIFNKRIRYLNIVFFAMLINLIMFYIIRRYKVYEN